MSLARISDRNIWVIYATALLLGVAYGVSISVIAIHLDDHGIPKLAMGGLAAAFALGIVSLSLPAGWFVERFGAKRTLFVALVGYTACVSVFPFLTTTATMSVARFFDGACSAGIWVSAETALLARSEKSNKAFVMSLYAMSLAIGYVVGPILAAVIVPIAGTRGTFIVAGVLALAAAVVVATKLDDARAATFESAGEKTDASALALLWKTKTSCLATFSYGYFQASVVLFLPLFLISEKGIAKSHTILVTAFFAAGMLLSSPIVSRFADRYGHLRIMTILGAIGGTMVLGFVLLSSFPAMCAAVFVAGATLAAISPVSLALQGVILPASDLGRANAFYNAAYAVGMLLGPPVSGYLFERWGGAQMLVHLSMLWAGFVLFTVVFASDDPKRARSALVTAPENAAR